MRDQRPPVAARDKRIREAQARYERESEASRQKRQKVFADAQVDGYSLSEIAKIVGLHRSRIDQIIKGK